MKKKQKKHYTIKNTLGGSFCKKCLNWSSEPDGLKDYECLATNKEKKENMKLLVKPSP